MKGIVTQPTIDEQGTGTIEGEDGKNYLYRESNLIGGFLTNPPEVGTEVTFTPSSVGDIKTATNVGPLAAE